MLYLALNKSKFERIFWIFSAAGFYQDCTCGSKIEVSRKRCLCSSSLIQVETILLVSTTNVFIYAGYIIIVLFYDFFPRQSLSGEATYYIGVYPSRIHTYSKMCLF